MDRAKKAAENKEKYLEKHLLERRGYFRRDLLGRGAFAKVYSVEGKSDGGWYACKVSRTPKLLEREAQVMSKLRHPLFPKYVAYWEEAGLGFLLREYVQGSNLEEAVRRQGRFSAGQTARVGLALAEGLHYLHSRPERYLFRDVKPSNVILGQAGGVKLIDLGCICSMDEEVKAYAGTLGFAAPEQLHGEAPLTAVCDVYGLGQTLKAMLGACVSRPGCSGREKGMLMLEKPTRWWGVSRKLWRILDACTREDAARRIPDMESLCLALTSFVGG